MEDRIQCQAIKYGESRKRPRTEYRIGRTPIKDPEKEKRKYECNIISKLSPEEHVNNKRDVFV